MTSRVSIVALFVCLLGLALSVAMAQDPPKRVVIQLKDGKSMSGELIEATPAIVKIKPNPKAEVVEIEWGKIRRLGNGPTRESIVKEWQASRAEELCADCKGNATATCPTCEGTAVKPAEKQPCTQCSGAGNLGECKTPRCEEGKIPCPGKCLKAETFQGTPDAEGKRWRVFRGRSGTNLRISDAHVGEVVAMENGEPVMKGKCPTCDGTTRVIDPACKGTELKPCAACHGHGVVGPACDDCDAGQVACPTCKGTGLRSVEAPAAEGATGT